MSNSNITDTRSLVESLQNQLVEDPHREPHEKETGLHVAGDESTISITSFKRVVYESLLRRPEFSVTRVNLQTGDGRQETVETLAAAAETSHSIIGVVGEIPVGALTIGTPRNSDSHAGIVTEP